MSLQTDVVRPVTGECRTKDTRQPRVQRVFGGIDGTGDVAGMSVAAHAEPLPRPRFSPMTDPAVPPTFSVRARSLFRLG